jgi:hypothetical protein
VRTHVWGGEGVGQTELVRELPGKHARRLT